MLNSTHTNARHRVLETANHLFLGVEDLLDHHNGLDYAADTLMGSVSAERLVTHNAASHLSCQSMALTNVLVSLFIVSSRKEGDLCIVTTFVTINKATCLRSYIRSAIVSSHVSSLTSASIAEATPGRTGFSAMDPSSAAHLTNFLQAQAAGPLSVGLTNDVHPSGLFRRENFTSAIDYDLLLPVLRLLTRMLDTPQLLRFLWLSCFGRNEKIDGSDREVCRSSQTLANLSQDDIQAVEEELSEFANMITFTVEEIPDRGIHGQTQFDKERTAAAAHPFERGLPGPYTTIVLTKRIYDELLTHHEGYSELWCSTRLNVAMILLHELGHAINWAVVGPREDFFEDAIVAEAGFEMESQLLGAAFEGRGKVFTFVEWPDREFMQLYGDKMTCRDPSRLPKQGRMWEVSSSWLLALWQDRYWEWVRETGPQALIPPAIAHSVREAISRGERIPVHPAVADLFRQSSGAIPSREAGLRMIRCIVKERRYVEWRVYQALERARYEAKTKRKESARQTIEGRECPKQGERAGHQAQDSRREGPAAGVMKTWWRQIANDL